MADNTSTTDEVDTTESVDTVDTTLDTTEDSELDDVEITAEDLGDETPEEQKDEETEEESESEEQESNEEAETEEESSDESEEPVVEEDQANIAREAYKQREANRKEREANLAEEQAKYVQEAADEKDEALRMLQVEAYNNRVDRTTNTLTGQWQQAINSIEEFQNPSPEVKQILDDAVDEFQALYVDIDSGGNPINVRGNLLEHLNKKADIIRALKQGGVRQGNKDRAKTKSAAITPPSKSPPAPKSDPDMDAFDEEASRQSVIERNYNGN